MDRRLWLLVFATIAIGGIALFKGQKEPVTPEPQPARPVIDYSSVVKPYIDQANGRNINALKTFELEANRIIEHYRSRMRNAVASAVQEAADYGSCCKIVYYLAWDKVRGGSYAQDYLNAFSKKFLDPRVTAMGKELNAAANTLNYKLRGSTFGLATDLAAIGPSDDELNSPLPDEMSDDDFSKAMRNLGFDASGILVSIAFDAVAVGRSQLVGILQKKIISIASRLFGKQTGKMPVAHRRKRCQELLFDVGKKKSTILAGHKSLSTLPRGLDAENTSPHARLPGQENVLNSDSQYDSVRMYRFSLTTYSQRSDQPALDGRRR